MQEIRKANDDDVAAIASLMTYLGYPTTAAQMRNRLQRMAVDRNYANLVAVDEGKVVGFVGLAFGTYYEHDGSYVRIAALAVAPEAQRKGIGKKLVAAAEELANARGAITCIVNSGLQRDQAHRFYEGLGFFWKSKAFYKPLRIAEQAVPADRADKPRSA
jgi:predicted N-acetyltransferase YhbS